ncbi:MFS monocarboxylate transporter, partial [Metarhizium majus ARSEF 297]
MDTKWTTWKEFHLPRRDVESEAQDGFASDLGSGYFIEPTSGKDLLCALYATQNSCRFQLASKIQPSVEQLLQIVEVQKSGEFNSSLEIHGRHNTCNFYVDQVGAALHEWGLTTGLSLQLGYVLSDGMAYLVPTPGERSIRIWIHSSSHTGISKGMDHYSAIRPLAPAKVAVVPFAKPNQADKASEHFESAAKDMKDDDAVKEDGTVDPAEEKEIENEEQMDDVEDTQIGVHEGPSENKDEEVEAKEDGNDDVDENTDGFGFGNNDGIDFTVTPGQFVQPVEEVEYEALPELPEPLSETDNDVPAAGMAKVHRLFWRGQLEQTLLMLDGEAFPHTPSETIRKVGPGLAAGLRVLVQLQSGKYTANQLEIHFKVRNGNTEERVMEIRIPLNNARFITSRLHTENDVGRLKASFGKSADVETELISGRSNIPDYVEADWTAAVAAKWSKRAEDLTDAEFMYCYNEYVVRVQCAVPPAAFSITKSTKWWESPNLSPHRQAIAAALEEFTARLHDNKEDAQLWSFMLPCTSDWPENWTFTMEVNSGDNSYGDFLTNTQELKQLDHKSINLETVERPRRPFAPVTSFANETQYAVIQIAANVDAIVLSNIKAAVRPNVIVKVVVVPFPNSKWTPQPTDKEVYGVEADGLPRSYLFLTEPDEHTKSFLPEVDESVKFWLDAEQTYHESPDKSQSPEAIERKAGTIIRHIRILVDKAEMIACEEEKQHINSMKKGSSNTILDDGGRADQMSDDEAAESFDFEKAREKAFRQGMKKLLLEYIGSNSISNELRERHPNESEDRLRTFAAGDIADDFFPMEDENAFLNFVKDWVSKQEHPAHTIKEDNPLGLPFTGHRIAQPPGYPTSWVFFRVERPTQPQWPPAYRPPYVMVSPQSQMKEDTNNEGQWKRKVLESGQTVAFNGGMVDFLETCHNATTLNGFLYSRDTDTTANTAAAAVRDCVGLREGSVGKALFTYQLNFSHFPARGMRNLHLCYPLLGKKFREGKYDADMMNQLAPLSNTKGGQVFVTGAAGTGKTKLACEMVCAAQDGGYLSNAGWLDDVFDPSKQQTSLLKPNPNPEDDGVLKNLEDICVKPLELEPEKQSGNKTAQMGGPSSWEQRAATTVEPLVEMNEKINHVMWSAAQNKQADDACQRLSQAPYSRNCVRVFPLHIEIDHTLMAEPPQPKEYEKPDKKKDCQAHVALVDHVNNEFARLHGERNPSLHERSLASLSHKELQKHPGKWQKVEAAIKARKTDPLAWKAKFQEAVAEVKELHAFVLNSHGTIVCTVVVMAQIANHYQGWSPILVVVDEAGRLTEALNLVPLSKWPSVPRIICGDTKQFKPVDPTYKAVVATRVKVNGEPQDFKYNQIFNQAGMSLLKRAKIHGAIDVHLDKNFRPWGTVQDFAAYWLNGGEVTIPNRRGNEVTERLQEWWRELRVNALSNQMLIEIDTLEEKTGDSYINVAHARFSVEHAIQILRDFKLPCLADILSGKRVVRYGKILILCAYKQHVVLCQRYLKEISRHELPPGLIEVRTIDDSAGAQFEYVIVNLVRSNKTGFVGEFERLNVALSRAMIGQTIITNGLWLEKQSGDLKKLWNYHEYTSSFFKCEIDKTFCHRCQQFGHHKAQCPADPECSTCTAKRSERFCKHSARNCRNLSIQQHPANDVSVDIRPDNIERNPFFAVKGTNKSGEPDRKRQPGKKQKAQRVRGPAPTDGRAQRVKKLMEAASFSVAEPERIPREDTAAEPVQEETNPTEETAASNANDDCQTATNTVEWNDKAKTSGEWDNGKTTGEWQNDQVTTTTPVGWANDEVKTTGGTIGEWQNTVGNDQVETSGEWDNGKTTGEWQNDQVTTTTPVGWANDEVKTTGEWDNDEVAAATPEGWANDEVKKDGEIKLPMSYEETDVTW